MKPKLKLLKKGILEEFHSDFLCLPWKVREELLDSIRDFYADEDVDLDWYLLYSTLFYFVYDSQFDPKTNPTAKLFQMFYVFRKEWVGREC